MFERKNFTYVLTALEAIEKIKIYCQDIHSAEEFFQINDQLNFNGCQVLLLVIGEETKKLHADLKSQFDNIPWHLITGLRNRIAHDYRSIDPYISWDIIQNYLPELKIALVEMLPFIDYDRPLLEKALRSNTYPNLKYLIE